MKLPSRFKHLRFQLADVDTQDVSQFFDASYQFIEEGRGANEGAACARTDCWAWDTPQEPLSLLVLLRFTMKVSRVRVPSATGRCELKLDLP